MRDSHPYLQATGRAEIASLCDGYAELLRPDPDTDADPDAIYDQVVRLDLSTLEPHVVGPHSPDRARPISALAAEVGDPENSFVDVVSSALIGSCTNSSYEDMSRAADVAEQGKAHGLGTSAPFLVTPGSERVRATIERDGQIEAFKAIDGAVLANACGPCIGQWRRRGPETPNTILTSYNRNFPSRNDGQPETMNFIASPEIVTATALAGRLSFNPLTDTFVGSDGREFRLSPPQAAPETPEAGFEPGEDRYVAPPQDGSDIALEVDPKSERLQLIAPWAAWNGDDFTDMPVLAKTKGKTTTDHISPAGPWLSLRGHLDRFSDNMLMGAVNAFTGARGKGTNVATGGPDEMYSKIARNYKSGGVNWVIVGDTNYGEGSSREHAALSPRLLGGVAVIARSFARIHETNLKKQGLLALTFVKPANHAEIREDDRINLVDLAELAPNKPVTCRIIRSDGAEITIQLRHSYSEAQLEWFRAGSALNVSRSR